MKVISVTGLKGGVGKTSTAVNLAALAGAAGWRTLLWDLDAQGAASHCVGVPAASVFDPSQTAMRDMVKNKSLLIDRATPTTVPGVSVIAADESLRLFDRTVTSRRSKSRMRMQIERVAKTTDVVIIDSPPGLGSVLDRLIEVSDLIVLPAEPSPLALQALANIRGYIATRGSVPMLAVLSMVDERKPLHRRMIASCSQGSIGFAQAAIPTSSAVERMSEQQRPTVLASPSSLATARYRLLWTEITELVNLSR